MPLHYVLMSMFPHLIDSRRFTLPLLLSQIHHLKRINVHYKAPVMCPLRGDKKRCVLCFSLALGEFLSSTRWSRRAPGVHTNRKLFTFSMEEGASLHEMRSFIHSLFACFRICVSHLSLSLCSFSSVWSKMRSLYVDHYWVYKSLLWPMWRGSLSKHQCTN